MCKQCAVTVGGRLRCEACYIESQLGPEAQTSVIEGRASTREKGNPKSMLLTIGALGSLIGVLMPIINFVLYYQEYTGPSLFAMSIGSISLLTGLWFGVQAVGFLGIYRNYGEIMGILALLLGVGTAVTYITFGVLLLTNPSYFFLHSDIVYIVPSNIQAVTIVVQAATFLSIRHMTSRWELFASTSMVLIAVGCISWLSYAVPVLSVSNVLVTLCFLTTRMPFEPEHKPKPEAPIIDALKELR
ncbi:MAG: hypothetical protein C4K49_06665 [Candidatus Thorarchaeota archaeon]|nr:MAG: hypothetical protein C4K49_06665 [Candidatus Thorarchaeota archaeon]